MSLEAGAALDRNCAGLIETARLSNCILPRNIAPPRTTTATITTVSTKLRKTTSGWRAARERGGGGGTGSG